MKKKLPKGESSLPIVTIEGKWVSVDDIKRNFPKDYVAVLFRWQVPKVFPSEILIERVRLRHAQGRVPTIYRVGMKPLTPQQQLKHMEQKTAVGLELIKAEKGLLLEELKILRQSE